MLLGLFSLAPVGASSANISHSYHSTVSIPNGSIVSLDPSKADYVVPANSTNGSQILGVAVASDDSLLAVDPTQGAVQVATSGDANTLVSTVNGSINVGDKIAVSRFDGVGMKAIAGAPVIGLAQTAFNNNSDGAQNEQATDKNGKTTSLEVGFVRISIATGTNGSDGGPELSSLQKLGKSLTGHTVSTPRVVISLLIALVSLAAVVTLIYASVFGGVISIGRNPLAKYAILNGIFKVLAMVLLLVVVASAAIFLILR